MKECNVCCLRVTDIAILKADVVICNTCNVSGRFTQENITIKEAQIIAWAARRARFAFIALTELAYQEVKHI